MAVVKAPVLENLIYNIFFALGSPEEEARTEARIIVDSNLTGHDSHGVNLVPSYVKSIKAKVLVPGAPIKIEKETASTARVDGNWNLGHVVAKRSMEIAIEKAKKTDIAIVVARRLGHIGRVGTYPEMAAKAGFIGFACCSMGGGLGEVAAFGGYKRAIGTNPMSWAFPTDMDGPVLLDMATSVVAAGKVRIARSREEKIPEHWVLDKDGKPTTNPNDFFNDGALQPLGGLLSGHKGYGLAMVVESLCGPLSRDGFAGQNKPQFSNSSTYIAINPEAFVPLDTYKQEIAELVKNMKAQKTLPGVKAVQMPGDKEINGRKEHGAHGIDVEVSTWTALKDIVKELKLESKVGKLP